MDAKQWFREAKYGMMVHWGLYTLLGGEWQGRRMQGIGEWAQQYYRIPIAEYEKLARAFNPVFFDADEWVQMACDAGFRYVVITAKHHDGFCLYHTKVDRWNVVDATPFGRDIIAELADACARRNMKLGLYYSQDLDWHEPNGGGGPLGKSWAGETGREGDAYWTNNWDFPDEAAKNYAQCFEEKIKPQVKELLTGYGELCLMWFDCPSSITPEQSRELAALVKHHQPDCLINSRIGNGIGDYHSTGDNQHDFDVGALAASREKHSVLSGLYECPATLNDTWGYKPYDNNWKSPQEVLELLNRLDARGVNLLLNVGPDPLGRIPAPAQQIFRAVGSRLQK
ncbi:MAG: alpha-L-fucosidase [Oscillospiraceae bacterium]|nr:alpha-L-fucosidase [Oscillospiraceae bacterium]